MYAQSPCTLINEFFHRLFCETNIPTVGVGQNGGSFLAPPAPLDHFFQFFFRFVIPYWAGNVSKKLRRTEFIVYAVVYICTDPGNLTFQNFLPLFLQIFLRVLFAPPPAPSEIFFLFFCSVISLTATPRELLDFDE